jgi:hypothetical protein
MLPIKFIYKVFVITLILGLFFCTLLAEDNVATSFQFKVVSAYNKLLKKYGKNNIFIKADIEKLINPLLDEALKKPNILRRNDDNSTSAFKSLLQPYIGYVRGENLKNPCFSYILTRFLNSKRFKEGGIDFQQEVCLELLSYLSSHSRAELYKQHHSLIINLLFRYFHDKKLYSKVAIGLIEKTIAKNNIPLSKYLLLLWIIDKPLDYQVKFKLKSLADTCKKFNRKKLSPWIALILLAKDGEKKYLDKLVSITKQTDNSMQGIKKATYIFPYLSIVQKPEIVELMKTFLKDKKIIDQGDDVMHRYTGLSYMATQVLYTMLDGYVKFARYKFNQNEREKCLNWFKNNSPYKFRKINYWESDRIISRMRYMIFYVR